MMIQKIFQYSFFLATLFVLISPATAGKLYRFPNEEGVPTLSRNLPPSASQKGYDILDDKTLRLLEHVEAALTQEQIIEFEKQQQLEKEAQRQAEIDAKQAEISKKQEIKRQHRRAIDDQNLIANYATEQDLTASHDKNINHRQQQLAETTTKQSKLEQKLLNLQQQAAEQELSGKGVSSNQKKQLEATQQEIQINTKRLEQLNNRIAQLTEQYDKDLIRLRELLKVENTDI